MMRIAIWPPERLHSDTRSSNNVGPVAPVPDSAVDDSDCIDESPLSRFFCPRDRPDSSHGNFTLYSQGSRQSSSTSGPPLVLSHLYPLVDLCLLYGGNGCVFAA